MDWVIDSTDGETWVKVQELYCTWSWHERPLKMYKNHESKNEFLKLYESSTLKHDIIRHQQIVYTSMYKCPELIQWNLFTSQYLSYFREKSMNMNLGKLQETVRDRQAWPKRVRHDWAAEQQQRKNSTERGRWIFTYIYLITVKFVWSKIIHSF